ncbi:hypothetical protein C0993_011736 [Termitomyces sp. T159_Od127]|nr:hypothetical protein C0993_011736 [Termitomyces sp. T159_Od127]
MTSLGHNDLSGTLEQWADRLLKFHKLYQCGAIPERTQNMLQVDLHLWDELRALVDKIHTSPTPQRFEDPVDSARSFHMQREESTKPRDSVPAPIPRQQEELNTASNCHDLLLTPRTQPWPWDSNPPKTTPTTAPGPDRYPANSLGNPRLSLAITARRHHQPPPLAAFPAITGHYRHSHRHLRHPPAITAVTATSVPVSAITLPIAATSTPAPPVTPSPCRDLHHASRSCITATNLCSPHPASAPSSPHHHHVSLRF